MSLPLPSATSRVAVTGASSGIGAALAEEFARRGYSLILIARRAAILHETATRLSATYGITVDVRPADLSDPEVIATVAKELASQEISILVNNAGIATFGAIKSLDANYELAQVQLNSVAVHQLALAVLPQMVARRSGGILNVGSAAGNMPIPHNATYAATKAFVNTFSESLRHELRSDGIHVTLLAPGPVRTELPDPADASLVDKVVPDFLWNSSEYVAKLSIDALEKNKMRVVPGIISKAMSVAGGYTPRKIVAPIVSSFYKKLS